MQSSACSKNSSVLWKCFQKLFHRGGQAFDFDDHTLACIEDKAAQLVDVGAKADSLHSPDQQMDAAQRLFAGLGVEGGFWHGRGAPLHQ